MVIISRIANPTFYSFPICFEDSELILHLICTKIIQFSISALLRVVAYSCNPATWRHGWVSGLSWGVLLYIALWKLGICNKPGINGGNFSWSVWLMSDSVAKDRNAEDKSPNKIAIERFKSKKSLLWGSKISFFFPVSENTERGHKSKREKFTLQHTSTKV